MTTLSHWLHCHWLLILSLEIAITAPASVSWLCRCIWWLNVSWSYVTRWRHWLKHSATLKSLKEEFRVYGGWISWRSIWLNAKPPGHRRTLYRNRVIYKLNKWRWYFSKHWSMWLCYLLELCIVGSVVWMRNLDNFETPRYIDIAVLQK